MVQFPIEKCNSVYFICRYQEKLRVHALRVMAVVEKTLNRIDNEASAAKVMLYIRLTILENLIWHERP